ncbi:MAG TPA: hypothetical protein VFX50_11315, partial [Gemmatimonadales bacterium]|nr:hypothetical protein [Gemmatimonadales bacterium]
MTFTPFLEITHMSTRGWVRSAFALALLAAVVAAPALARTTANPAGRAVLGSDGPTGSSAAPGRERAASPAAAAVNVPLPAGAEQVDATWYDLQDMGSMGHHIEVGADGRVHVTWQDEFCELGGGCPPNLAAPQPHPNRGMGYAYRDAAGTWNVLGKVTDSRVPVCCGLRDLAGGFGSLALLPSGRVAIAQHLNEDGCDMHGYFHLEDASGSALFRSYLTPVVSPSLLFPQVSANANGSFTVLGEVPRGGSYDETDALRTSWLAAPGTF